MSDQKIQLIIEALNKTQSAFAAVEQGLQNIKANTQKMAASTKQDFANLNAGIDSLKQKWMTYSVAGVAAWMAIQKAMQYVELGAKAMQAETAFDNTAKSLGVNAGQMLDSMKKASSGTIDESHLMQKALKAMAQDVDPNKIPQLFEAASVGAVKSGDDIKDAADGIIDAIANQMPRGLRRFGLISKDEFNAFNKAIGAGAENLNLLDLVLANAKIQAAKMGIESYNAAIAVQQFKAHVEELKETLGKITLGVGQEFLGLLQGIAGFALGASTGIFNLIKGHKELLAIQAEKSGRPELAKKYREEYEYWAAQAAAGEGASNELYKRSMANMGTGKPGGAVKNKTELEAAAVNAEADKKKLVEDWKKMGMSKSFIDAQRAIMQSDIQGIKSGLDTAKEGYKLQDAIAEEHFKSGIDAENTYIVKKQNLEKSALTDTITALQKEKAETIAHYDAMYAAVLPNQNQDEERNKLAAEKKKEVARIDGEIAKTKIDLQIADKNFDIAAIERKQKLADVTREGQLSLLQEEVKLRTQLNSLQVERGTMTESQATAAEIAGNRAILDFQRKQIEEKIIMGGLTDSEDATLKNQLTIIDTQLKSWKSINADKLKQQQADEKTTETDRERLTNSYKLREDLATAVGDYKTVYEMQQQILEIERARALLAVTKKNGYTQDDIDAVNKYYDYMSNQMDEAAKNSWMAGAKQGLRDYSNMALDTFTTVKSAVNSVFKGMEDALTDFVVNGKASFSDFTNAVIKDLVRIAIQRGITGPLAGAAGDILSGFLNGSSTATAGAGASSSAGYNITGISGNTSGTYITAAGYHRGGSGNEPTFFRVVPSGMFDSAPRFHSGIGPGERAAIIRDDESVWTPGQVKALGRGTPSSVKVIINNTSNQKVEASSSNAYYDSAGMVVSIVLDAVTRNKMGLRDALTGGR